jgi:hypothetical protein
MRNLKGFHVRMARKKRRSSGAGKCFTRDNVYEKVSCPIGV